MNNSDYERLKSQGYSEEEIKAILENVSKIELSPSPMGPYRNDKATLVTDPSGNKMKSSNIMQGKKDIISDGEYINLEESMKALLSYVSSNQAGRTIVCKKTGKKVNVSSFVEGLKKELTSRAKISLDGRSEAIKNQNTQKVSIANNPKGILMLGNRGCFLSNGTYVSKEEFKKALSDYVYMKKENVPFTPKEPFQENTDRKEPEVSQKSNERNTKKVKRKLKLGLVSALISVTALMAALGLTKKNVSEEKLVEYVVKQIDTKENTKSVDEITQEILDTIKTGDTAYLSEGEKYYYDSDHAIDISSTIGQGNGLRQSGDYVIEYLSVIYNGKIANVTYDPNVSLKNILQETANKLGVNFTDLTVMGHARTSDGKIAGWINLKDAIKRGIEKNNEQIKDIEFLINEYTGRQENFDGTTISIEKENETVGIPATEGKWVIGSDGKEYYIDSINSQTVSNKTPNVEAAVAAVAAITAGAAGAYLIAENTEKNSNEEEKEIDGIQK